MDASRLSTGRSRGERGIALVLSMFLMLAMSVLAASLMFLSQTETYGTMNYRLMTQARYGAESGVHKAVNYLLNAYTTVKPGTAGDPFTNYNMSVSPVTRVSNGQPVVLSATTAVASNYPNATVQTAFNTAAQGSFPAGLATVKYGAYATLMSMQLTENNDVLQTWKIVSDGTIDGSRPATEEVSATLETQIVPTHGYATFATATTCGAITMSGGSATNSYDSSTYGGSGTPSQTNSNGDLGTNGNLSLGGTTTVVNGNLYTPRIGVGNCSSGNVTAESATGGATLNGQLVQLPTVWTPPTPVVTVPNPPPPTSNMTIKDTTVCSDLTSYLPAGATCSGSASNLKINPNGVAISWGNLTVSNGTTLTFYPGQYYMNSISVQNTNTTLNIGDATGTVPGLVKMTLVGTDMSTTLNMAGGGTLVVPSNRKSSVELDIAISNKSNNVAVDASGNTSIQNWSYDPKLFRINYGGSKNVNVAGGSASAFLLNAPNADVKMNGGANFYGSLLTHTMTNTGGTLMHYDRNLAGFYGVAGNPILSAFNWRRF